ncbi:ATP-dependent endonuclease [Chitinophaga sp. LS1]|uniref:ATP-dependent endonuclease n=1 Tax=Chitinophaga sp. LS1 TaxID=3051176 RepID=UPI002AAA715D|nr:AAA family ATPase [Chitinophaga sp. LS1]WPV67113.1 AAA family ATPase [Chitinophaga sp. LS1]
MKINFVHILNFRKLKSCRIDLTNQETIFVGANNSGKTSAMDALITFLKSKELTTRDFTLSNWNHLNKIGTDWDTAEDPQNINLNIEQWEDYLPSIDIWINVEPTEIHYVSHLIPTLDWSGGLLGVRLRYEPKDITNLYQSYLDGLRNSRSLSGKGTYNFKAYPKDMWDYLDRENVLKTHFTFQTYLLDPSLKDTPQRLRANAQPIQESAFSGLIKVDIINAQRGFSDINNDAVDNARGRNLSSQLRSYYDKHLNPNLKPSESDIDAMESIQVAKDLFDKNLQESFQASLGELEGLNYPGFDSPAIVLSSRFNPSETLNHETAVLYKLDDNQSLSLPEKYNGLGFQNLISIIFKLIRFRDEWMQVGKHYQAAVVNEEKEFELLHLVLIEEPEAHLHAQVQQVFIRKAYKVLREHKNLGDNKSFTTQLVISTHSNHIAHEIDFTSLRYFKRQKGGIGDVNTSSVVNLSNTFGSDNDTTRFAIRYLKTTHCDLFFADAAILVEGPAEKMLIPYFIKQHSCLSACYISILEIGGSHAHTLKPLIESLGIITLIVTDIDAVDPNDNYKKRQTEKGKGYLTGNDTIKDWLPKVANLDSLLDMKSSEKEHTTLPIKIAFQTPYKEAENTNTVVYPYTFEDCMVIENRSLFQKIIKSTGLLSKMVQASKEADIITAAKKMYDAITEKGAKKAEFALELLFLQAPEVLKTPSYIHEGLAWLECKLITNKQGLLNKQSLKPELNGSGTK